jgi:hypothetical protein
MQQTPIVTSAGLRAALREVLAEDRVKSQNEDQQEAAGRVIYDEGRA